MKTLPICLLTACWAQAAVADPVLPARAFVDPPVCRVDPYADASLEQRERRLGRSQCADRFALRPDTSQSRRPRLELEKNVAYRLDDLSFNFSLGWAGWRDTVRATSRTERATLAGGALVRLGPGWALDGSLGRDMRAGNRLRSTLTSLWKPPAGPTTFLQWSAEPSGLARLAGLRWWAVPNRFSFDLTVAAPPASAPLQPRLGLSIHDL